MHIYRLRYLREDKDLSQQKIAEMLGIQQRTYSRYETGEREIPLESLCKLADFHEVSVDYLLGRTDTPTPYPVKIKKQAQ